MRRNWIALICLVSLCALVAVGFVPYTSTRTYTWAAESIVESPYPGPTTPEHMPIVTGVATGDCAGLFRHDSQFGARPLVRYSDGHMGSSLPFFPTNPCVFGKTPMRNDLLAAIGVMALISAVVVAASSRRRGQGVRS